MHVRRGECLDYDKYYRVAKLVIRMHPLIQSLLVVTDADDCPLHKFQTLSSNVTFAVDIGRSRFNVRLLANQSKDTLMPERRNLGNATSELINEVKHASRCFAFVGTFSAGVSRWIMLLQIVRQGRIPVF
jgi:hypothetical protein